MKTLLLAAFLLSGADALAQARQPVEMPPPLAPAKKPGFFRRVTAGVVGGVTNSPGIGHEILYPGRAGEQAEYDRAVERARQQVALEAAQQPGSSAEVSAGCGIVPIKPIPPIGCDDLVAQCVCDSSGRTCNYTWICVKRKR